MGQSGVITSGAIQAAKDAAKIAAGQPLVVVKESPWDWAKRNKWWLIGGAVALVAFGGVGRKGGTDWFGGFMQEVF
jgi:hypothetical protein